jgi:hypothetical protein
MRSDAERVCSTEHADLTEASRFSFVEECDSCVSRFIDLEAHDVKSKRYELTPEQWRRIGHLLPGKPGDPGRSGGDNLTFVNGVLWVLRSDAHWHDLP